MLKSTIFSSSCVETTEVTESDEVGGPFNVHAQRHHRYRGWNVQKRRSRKVAASREGRGQELISAPPLLYVMKYMVPSVLVPLTLKYQAKAESLFWENPAPMWCFVAATCVYWLIIGLMKKQITTVLAKCVRDALSHTALASGILSAISLFSMFLLYPVSLVPLFIWIPLPVLLAWPVLKHAYGLLKTGITIVINKLLAVIIWARRLNSKEEASILPV